MLNRERHGYVGIMWENGFWAPSANKPKNAKSPANTGPNAMGDTGLELASGAQVRPYSPVLLAYGALRSAQVRSNCYQNCYQVRAVRGAGKDRSHASCSSSSSDAISADGGYLSSRESKRRGPAIGRISGRLRCGRRVLILVWCYSAGAHSVKSRRASVRTAGSPRMRGLGSQGRGSRERSRPGR